jgi:hypothetical protein
VHGICIHTVTARAAQACSRQGGAHSGPVPIQHTVGAHARVRTRTGCQRNQTRAPAASRRSVRHTTQRTRWGAHTQVLRALVWNPTRGHSEGQTHARLLRSHQQKAPAQAAQSRGHAGRRSTCGNDKRQPQHSKCRQQVRGARTRWQSSHAWRRGGVQRTPCKALPCAPPPPPHIQTYKLQPSRRHDGSKCCLHAQWQPTKKHQRVRSRCRAPTVLACTARCGSHMHMGGSRAVRRLCQFQGSSRPQRCDQREQWGQRGARTHELPASRHSSSWQRISCPRRRRRPCTRPDTTQAPGHSADAHARARVHAHTHTRAGTHPDCTSARSRHTQRPPAYRPAEPAAFAGLRGPQKASQQQRGGAALPVARTLHAPRSTH